MKKTGKTLHQHFWARYRLFWAMIGILGLLAAACSPATPDDDPDDDAAAEAEEPDDDGDDEDVDPADVDAELEDSFVEVLNEIEGLEGDEREERLIELANEEDGINVYTSNTEMQEHVDNFEDLYDGRLEIRPNVYRAPSNSMLSRILEEADAGFAGADLTEVHSPQLQALGESGILREYTSPYLEARDAELNFEEWFVVRMTAHAPAWNTELVSEDEVPTSLEDLVDERWQDDILVEPRAYDWFLTLWLYFEEQGWSDEEIEDYFRTLVDMGTQVQGFPEQTEFIVLGEAALLSGGYTHLVDGAREDGAPVDYEPFVEPVVIVPTGVALIRNAPNPAGAILFLDYLLDHGQDLYREQARVPPIELEEGGLLDGVEYIVTDPQYLVGDEGALWQDRWEAILQGQPLP